MLRLPLHIGSIAAADADDNFDAAFRLVKRGKKMKQKQQIEWKQKQKSLEWDGGNGKIKCKDREKI